MSVPPTSIPPNTEEENKIAQEKNEGFFTQLSGNIPVAIAYGFLTLSLFYCLFDPFYGAIPIGIILGIYFSKEAFELTSEFKNFVNEVGIFRSFIFLVAIVAFLLTATGLSLGIFIGSWIRVIYDMVVAKPEEREE